MKLSKAQARILKRLAIGDTLHWGTHTGGFFSHDLRGGGRWNHPLHFSSVRKLLGLGLIEDVEDPTWHWRGHKYVITDAGREYIDAD